MDIDTRTRTVVHNNINNIYQSTYQLQAGSSVSCPSLGYLWRMTRLHHWGLISSDGSVTFSLWRDCHLATKLVANSRKGRTEQAVEWNEVEFPDLQNLTHVHFHGPYVSCTLLHICSRMQIEIKATSQWPPSKWSLVRIPTVSLLLNWDLLRFVQIYV